MDKSPTRKIEERIGYRFRDGVLVRLALTHRSHANEQGERRVHNERFEFLGDALLGVVVSDRLFRHFPDATEGELTRMRAALVNETSLAAHARRLELGSSLLLGRGEERSGGREKDSILADAFEALLAAVYLDGGIDALVGLLDRIFFPYVDFATLPQGGTDHKTMLQELLHTRSLVPVYRIVETTGPEHERIFHVEVGDGTRILGEGVGSTRKRAEQQAAQSALARLKGENGG